MARKIRQRKPVFRSRSAAERCYFPTLRSQASSATICPIKIDSHFTGEIKSTELLVIGSNAQVDAQISARQVHLEGKLVGIGADDGLLRDYAGRLIPRRMPESESSRSTPERTSTAEEIF